MIQHNKPGKAFTNMLDDILNNSFNDLVGANIISKKPAANIYASEQGYVLEVAAPGLQKDSFDISVKDKELTISASIPDMEPEGSEHIKREFNFNNFLRKFSLSNEVDTGSILANYANGVLQITLAKKTTTEDEVKQVVID